jgi:protein Mpv17
VPTKALTSFFGFVLGDLLAQRIDGGPFDILRCLRLGTYGLTLDGPIGHWWYTVLDKYVEPQDPKSTKAVLIKTAADQLIWAPVMTCVFFAVLKSLEGHPELIWPTIQDKLVKTVAANYVIWPAAHFINFRFVPTEHRILYNNCVSIIWNAYLSTLSHTPVLDLDELGGLMDQTQSQFLDGLPPQAGEAARSFAGATRDTFRGLPGIDPFRPQGQHFGIELSVPRKFELHPTRMVPATLLNDLGALLGAK